MSNRVNSDEMAHMPGTFVRKVEKLLAEKDAEIARLHRSLAEADVRTVAALDDLSHNEEEIKRLRAALEVFANGLNWGGDQDDVWEWQGDSSDTGDTNPCDFADKMLKGGTS